MSNPNIARLRGRLFRLLESWGRQGGAGAWIDRLLIALILSNGLAAILETVPEIDERYRDAFAAFEVVSVLIFTVEYIARVWISVEHPELRRHGGLKARLRYMQRPMAIIDLVAILPAWLTFLGFTHGLDLRALRLVRLFRLFKLARYSPAVETFGAVIRSERRTLGAALLVMVLALIISATLMYEFERDVQPERFGTIPDAIWWAVATMSTVGYGDAVPSTLPGKILGGFVMLTGIALFALWTGVIASAFSEELRRRDFRISWEMVSQVPLFAALDAVQIGEIALLLRPLMLPGRYLVVRAGEPSTAMFFITSGEVEVELRPDPIRLGPGHYFGEIGLVHAVNRTATIVTLQETRLLVLERDSFETVMARHPEIRAAVEETARERLYWLGMAGQPAAGNGQVPG